MKKSKLSNEEIIQKIFSATEGYAKAQIPETRNYIEWKECAVYSVVSDLIELFQKEKADFINLCNAMGDMPSGMLSFKKTEAKLYAWKGRTGNRSGFFAPLWWGSDVRSWLESTIKILETDKRDFLEKWKDENISELASTSA